MAARVARKENTVGLNQRILPGFASAIAGLVLAASTTAAAEASPSGRSTAPAVSGLAVMMRTQHRRCIKVIATIPVGVFPAGVAVNEKTNAVYVTNFGNRANHFKGTVSVISGRTNTVTATIGVGRQPQGIAADPKTNTIYVANSQPGVNTVSVISGRANTVTAAISVPGPGGAA